MFFYEATVLIENNYRYLGMLTVNPKDRLTLAELQSNEWIRGSNEEVYSTTPLATPDMLSLTKTSVRTVRSQISATMSAFHRAHRAGFRLQDVGNAPLARRRKMKQSGSSCDSSRSATPVHSRDQSPCRTVSPMKGGHSISPSPLAAGLKLSQELQGGLSTQRVRSRSPFSEKGGKLSAGVRRRSSSQSDLPILGEYSSLSSTTSRGELSFLDDSFSSTNIVVPMNQECRLTSSGNDTVVSKDYSLGSFHAVQLGNDPDLSGGTLECFQLSEDVETVVDATEDTNAGEQRRPKKRKMENSTESESYGNGTSDGFDDDDDIVLVSVDETNDGCPLAKKSHTIIID